METLGEYLRGDFEFYRSIQGNVRGHCRRNIAYVDSPDDLAAIRGAVVFTEGEYGIRTASIHDAEALSDLSEARSWDYLVFLEDLTLDLLFTDYYEPLTGTLRTEEDLKLVAQVFLASASTAKVLYQGYVTGKADDSLYSNRMELSFVGNLIRGPLRLR